LACNGGRNGGPGRCFVTFRAGGSTLRERLSPVRWPGRPSWAGSPGSREGPIDLKPSTGTLAVPSCEEPNDRSEGTSPPRKMAIADDGTKEPRWPGGSWWDGRHQRDTGSARMRWWITAGSVLPGVCRSQAESRPPVTPPRDPVRAGGRCCLRKGDASERGRCFRSILATRLYEASVTGKSGTKSGTLPITSSSSA